MTKISDRYVLITNLDYVTIGAVRTCTHALLVVTEEHPLQLGTPRHLLRGFGTTPSVPVFDTVIPTAKFTIEPAASHNVRAARGSPERLEPLVHGGIMRIPGFGDVQLVASINSRAGLDVEHYPDGTGIDRIWSDLTRKVIEHWQAPGIMQPQWVSVTSLRGTGCRSCGDPTHALSDAICTEDNT